MKVEQIKLMQSACHALEPNLKRHPEHDLPGAKAEIHQTEYPVQNTQVTIVARFEKHGREIFSVPPEMAREDYDWPTLTETDAKWLTQAATAAAKSVGLQLCTDQASGESVAIYIRPSEKGWVDVGYRHQAAPNAS